MSILRKAGTVAAISVAGAGIAIGGIGLASADDSTSAQDSTTQSDSPSGEGRGHGHGPGGGGDRGGDRGGPSQLASGLAEALELEESDVTAALESAQGQHEPGESAEGETRTQPTEAEREARQEELVAALASELDVSEQQITEAMESLRDEQTSEGRSRLGERLDSAVTDGDLTDADKESVLKAFDAGVLRGGRR